jgi:adenylylsulfate kinase-like enzyme
VASRPALFLLIGFAGTGKLTVARVLRDRLTRGGGQARLVDNHYVNNPIFHLLDVDGVKPLPAGAWDRVGEVRDAVLRTIEDLSPKSWSFIFTNDLIDRPEERAYVHRLAQLADRRRSIFVPVRLLCDVEELCARVVSPERRGLMKAVDAEWIRQRALTEEVLDPGLAATITLDTTSMRPDETVDLILAHLATLGGPPHAHAKITRRSYRPGRR